jgi:hypothetical protein
MALGLSASRACNIALRTAHIGATGILLGGHFFGVAAGRLVPLLYMAILTGLALGIAEIDPNWRSVFEVRSLVIASKALLLCLVPLLWNCRVAILMIVVAMASAGSHMPRRFRHYSVLEHQNVKAMGERPGAI